MTKVLDRDIRKQLDKVVREARKIAEDGARKALTELGVEDARKPDGLTPEKAELRNRLRARARSLGDTKQPNDSIKANRLVREIAYEHWHRALFARFLAENNLLIDPEHKVAVSLSELEEIAREEGADPMALAANWAEPMLPQIFRKDDPVLALGLPPETKAGIAEFVNRLPRAVFEADDSLGWTYQFWQADEKDRVNRETNTSDKKIGADELPAVTQLFTEDYMVLFLLENTLGAWWAGKQLAADPALAASAQSEDELRSKTSPCGYAWTYLRFVRMPRQGEAADAATGPWRPAAGTFDGWPKEAKEVTLLDPCMGSGHFLVFALPILIAFLRVEEGLDERAAVKTVLANNLFGLEIDPRCTQIAAFALAIASWKLLGGPEVLPKLNLACSGLAIGVGKEAFLRLAEKLADVEGWTGKGDLLGTDRSPLGARVASTHRVELEALYELFEQAPYLGSLIDPRGALGRKFGPLYSASMDSLTSVLERLLEDQAPSVELRENAVTAQGLSVAARFLGRDFTLIATNVPYLGYKKSSDKYKQYVDSQLRLGRMDLSTAMIERYFLSSSNNKTIAIVSPQGWNFLGSYKPIRTSLLKSRCISLWSFLGPRAFETISGEVVSVCLSIATNAPPSQSSTFAAIDLTQVWGADKPGQLRVSALKQVCQRRVIDGPDSRIVLEPSSGTELLSKYAVSMRGIVSGDGDYWVRAFWEVPELHQSWRALQGTVDSPNTYGGRSNIINWSTEGQGMLRPGSENQAYGKAGVAVAQLGDLYCTIYSGDLYDNSTAAIFPLNEEDAASIYAFCVSSKFRESVRAIDKKMNVTNATLVKVPFDKNHWRSVAAREYPNGLPKPYSNEPTQWLFDGHPRGSADPNATTTENVRLRTPYGIRSGSAKHPLQVAVARLLGYRWPRQSGSSFMDCPAISEPDEIDASGLVDADGLVALPALAGETDAASRLRGLIRAIWSADYDETTIRALLAAEESKTSDFASWLADEFFDGHCRLFHQTPFIWHVWDGARAGFSALINYHKLCARDGAGRRLLEKLRDVHLGEWIAMQERAQTAGEPGAEERVIAAEHLRDELTKIIIGEPPYDIFVRWKPLRHQPIGWEPDIDDGVRLNIRPFLTAKPRNRRGKDACILRITPRGKKHDGADRGTEPHRDKDEYPWFWAEDNDVATENFAGGPDFKGRRYNGFHYNRSFKEAVRAAKAAKV